LCLVGGGIAATALGLGGGLGLIVERSGIVTTHAGTAAADPPAVDPAGGAGLFDVDPDQDGLSQDPDVTIEGDIASLPEDMEL